MHIFLGETSGARMAQEAAAKTLIFPIIDLSSPDRVATSRLIRQACVDSGFFYLINHGIDEDMFEQVFDQSKKFFQLSIQEKLELSRNKDHRGYTPLYVETLDTSIKSKGDSKESFYIGPVPIEGSSSQETHIDDVNQWPSEATLPHWRATMEAYYDKVLSAGIRVISLIALALNLSEDFFMRVGALDSPAAFIRLLHYPGELPSSEDLNFGASAHSDYGMITLLLTDGVNGLQICREKDKQPQIWEDVPHLKGAFVVNIGDMLERWTNCLFRSTLHRVIASGQERYSVAFFLDPNFDCLVECLESCCSETIPARFPPIRSGDYLKKRLWLTYSSG
ncbi:hypothetical protein AMTRI_Chr13g116110 [Amborella trichopoda]